MGANTKRFAMWRERKSVTLFAWKSEQKSSILSFLEGGQELLESRLRRYDHQHIRFMRSALLILSVFLPGLGSYLICINTRYPRVSTPLNGLRISRVKVYHYVRVGKAVIRVLKRLFSGLLWLSK